MTCNRYIAFSAVLVAFGASGQTPPAAMGKVNGQSGKANYLISLEAASKNEELLKLLSVKGGKPSSEELGKALQTIGKSCGSCMIISEPGTAPDLSGDIKRMTPRAGAGPIYWMVNTPEKKEDCPSDHPFFDTAQEKNANLWSN